MRTKGYVTSSGYMGFIPSKNNYMLFDTENEYYTYLNDDEQNRITVVFQPMPNDCLWYFTTKVLYHKQLIFSPQNLHISILYVNYQQKIFYKIVDNYLKKCYCVVVTIK